VGIVVAPAAEQDAPFTLPGLEICSAWTTPSQVKAVNTSLSGVADETLELPIGWASEWLYRESGRQWPGICTTTVRPEPQIRDGQVCSTSEVALNAYPVVEIVQVIVDGVVLSPTRYRLDNDRTLVRMPDEGTDRAYWPSAQRMDLPVTAEHTWAVTFRHGAAPPLGGQAAAAVLSGELAIALGVAAGGDGKCRLPRRTQQVVRQGVTVMTYPKDLLASGRTGIAEIDMWLHSVNPGNITRRATVASPDYRRGTRRTGA
jgi:hypothetical protein